LAKPVNDKVKPAEAAGQAAPAAGKAVPFGTGPRHRRRWLVLVDLLIAALALSGLYLVISPIVIHALQDRLTRELVDSYNKGDGTIIIDQNYLEISGEEVLYPDATEPTTAVTGSSGETSGQTSQPASSPAPTPVPAPVRVTIKAIGRILIPSINVDMPVTEGSTSANLRVAIGHFSESADFGQSGNCILFGHRMYTYGRHFNRLGEVKIGQQIILEDKKNRYVYEVDQIDTILPEQLVSELFAPVSGSRIMLVTCTPVRVASHRLLVKGKLVSTEPLNP
jgi:sortase A